MQDEGLNDFGSDANGVVVASSSGASVRDFSANDNQNYGVWLQASSSTIVESFDALGNAQTGIYVG